MKQKGKCDFLSLLTKSRFDLCNWTLFRINPPTQLQAEVGDVEHASKPDNGNTRFGLKGANHVEGILGLRKSRCVPCWFPCLPLWEQMPAPHLREKGVTSV